MDIKIIAIIAAPILGFAGWVTKHITNSKKHPCKSDIVFKDVCETKQDCIEGEIKNLSNRVDDMKKDMNRGFDRLEAAIRNGN